MELFEHEVVEDLGFQNLKIIRDMRGFTYGTDAVLLASFVRAKSNETLLDLGAGTGILSILINAKTGARFEAVELDEGMCDMAKRSVELNGQQAAIRINHADLRTLAAKPGFENFHAAVSNPPYFTGGTKSADIKRCMSTHQEECTVYDVAACANRLVKNGGRLFMVYPASLFAQACHALGENRFAVKRAKLVFTKRGAAPHVVLLEAKKGGRASMVWETPLLLNDMGYAQPMTP